MTRLARTSLLVLSAALAPPAAAAPRISGLEPLEASVTWTLPHAQRGRPDRPATRTCQVFARWAVLFSDEGEMGADDVEVRARPPGPFPKRVCEKEFAARSVRLKTEEVFRPVGVFERWLVAESPDGPGLFTTLWLVELESGRPVFHDEYDRGRGLTLRRDGGDAELGYWARLDGFPCVPHAGAAACGPRVRDQLHLPPTVPAPDCGKALTRRPPGASEKLDAGQLVELAAHVRVHGFQRDRAEYLPERPVCAASP